MPRWNHCGARLFGSGLLFVLLLVLFASCADRGTRPEIVRETQRGPLVVTTMGATEFLSRELLRGVAETRLLGLRVPRERRAEPTPDEVVMIANATLIVAYGGEADSNAVAMVRREAPDKNILSIRSDGASADFSWLKGAVLRDDAHRLHELLIQEFDSASDRSRLDANLRALDLRLQALEEVLAEIAENQRGQRVFTDDPRIHPFLESLGMGIISTIALGPNLEISDEVSASIQEQAAGLPVRILIITDPEKKQQSAVLAREADLTLVYFNPFFDGASGVGQMDTVIPRQLAMLQLAQSYSLIADIP